MAYNIELPVFEAVAGGGAVAPYAEGDHYVVPTSGIYLIVARVAPTDAVAHVVIPEGGIAGESTYELRDGVYVGAHALDAGTEITFVDTAETTYNWSLAVLFQAPWSPGFA